jgi:hypothetical protein
LLIAQGFVRDDALMRGEKFRSLQQQQQQHISDSFLIHFGFRQHRGDRPSVARTLKGFDFLLSAT